MIPDSQDELSEGDKASCGENTQPGCTCSQTPTAPVSPVTPSTTPFTTRPSMYPVMPMTHTPTPSEPRVNNVANSENKKYCVEILHMVWTTDCDPRNICSRNRCQSNLIIYQCSAIKCQRCFIYQCLTHITFIFFSSSQQMHIFWVMKNNLLNNKYLYFIISTIRLSSKQLSTELFCSIFHCCYCWCY